VISSEIRFRFRNNLIFAQGTAAYYRVRFTTMSAYNFSGSEEMWTSTETTKTFLRDIIATNTTWYLHVLSYNNQDAPSVQIAKGAYPLFQDITHPQISSFFQDGASRFNGAHPGLESGGVPPLPPALDISFFSEIAWVPGVHTIH